MFSGKAYSQEGSWDSSEERDHPEDWSGCTSRTSGFRVREGPGGPQESQQRGTAVLTACPSPLSFLRDRGEVGTKSEIFHLRHPTKLEGLAWFLSSAGRQSSDSWPFFKR